MCTARAPGESWRRASIWRGRARNGPVPRPSRCPVTVGDPTAAVDRAAQSTWHPAPGLCGTHVRQRDWPARRNRQEPCPRQVRGRRAAGVLRVGAIHGASGEGGDVGPLDAVDRRSWRRPPDRHRRDGSSPKRSAPTRRAVSSFGRSDRDRAASRCPNRPVRHRGVVVWSQRPGPRGESLPEPTPVRHRGVAVGVRPCEQPRPASRVPPFGARTGSSRARGPVAARLIRRRRGRRAGVRVGRRGARIRSAAGGEGRMAAVPEPGDHPGE
jgi:hypothetical protein